MNDTGHKRDVRSEAIEALGSLVSRAGGEGDDALDVFKDTVAEVERLREAAGIRDRAYAEGERVWKGAVERLREERRKADDGWIAAKTEVEQLRKRIEQLRAELQYVLDCDDGPGGRDAIEMMRIRAAVDGRPWPPSDVTPPPDEGETGSIWPSRAREDQS